MAAAAPKLKPQPVDAAAGAGAPPNEKAGAAEGVVVGAAAAAGAVDPPKLKTPLGAASRKDDGNA